MRIKILITKTLIYAHCSGEISVKSMISTSSLSQFYIYLRWTASHISCRSKLTSYSYVESLHGSIEIALHLNLESVPQNILN